jgi:hypothetical protein
MSELGRTTCYRWMQFTWLAEIFSWGHVMIKVEKPKHPAHGYRPASGLDIRRNVQVISHNAVF